jgi:hypothetical protein
VASVKSLYALTVVVTPRVMALSTPGLAHTGLLGWNKFSRSHSKLRLPQHLFSRSLEGERMAQISPGSPQVAVPIAVLPSR